MTEKLYIPESFFVKFGVSKKDDNPELYDIAVTSFIELNRDEQLEHITGYSVESIAFTLGFNPENPSIRILNDARTLLESWAREPITDPDKLIHRARNASNYDKEVGMLKGDVEAGRITEEERQKIENELYYKYKQNE